MAESALAGFSRVTLDPHQTVHLTVHIGARQLSYWSSAQQEWLIAGGQRAIRVGGSSRDIPLSTTITVN
jgi:beta-glucosidase